MEAPRSSAKGVSPSRAVGRRRENRGADGAEGCGCMEGVSPPHRGEVYDGAVPPPQKIFNFFPIFELKKASFGALWN